MSAISLLIKPASGLCNLQCKYCFYNDEMAKRVIPSFGKMTTTTSNNIIKKFLSIPNLTNITIAFQGGEPTIVGLDYFKNFINQVNLLNKNNVRVNYSLQTNGTLLDEKWCLFLKENNFLVGISLDGTAKIHNLNRLDFSNEGTFDIVYAKINLLKKYAIPFNILTVITKETTKNIKEIYSFYKKENYTYQQYIPCLDGINERKGKESFSLLPHDYEIFLKKLFDLYYNDIKKGKYVYNRYFENLFLLLLGHKPENCSMGGFCSIQYVIEGNGNTYPCDFYAIDKYLLGNINTDSIDVIDEARKNCKFIESSYYIDSKCKKCKYLFLCKTGCRRDKENNGLLSRNFFCSAYYNFLEEKLPKLVELVNLIKLGKFPTIKSD